MSNPAQPPVSDAEATRATTEVTIWSLEQTSPADLRPAAVPEGDLRIVRSEVVLPEFSRFLYTAVGGDIRWTDRLGMTYDEWQKSLERPGAETLVAYANGTPAGYVELDPQDGGVVEIMYFGLIPAFRGRRIGGHLLSYGVERAWDLAERWPERPPTERVWLHTCSRTARTRWTTTCAGASGSSTRRPRWSRTWRPRDRGRERRRLILVPARRSGPSPAPPWGNLSPLPRT
ncbi:hypothetical protein SVIOM74S_07571 [Streptomyces violarus]